MNILVISSYLPYPLHNGGHIRLYNILRELSNRHKITLICEKREKQTNQDIIAVKQFCEEVITVDRKKQWSYENILKSGFSNKPFLVVGHTLPEMKTKIVETLNSKRFDVIHVETFYVFQNLPKTYLPIVLIEHNIEYDVYAKYTKEANWFLKPLLYVDVAKIGYLEKYYWKKADRLVAVSEEDKRRMNRNDVVVAPNGVDPSVFAFKKRILDRKEKRILFMGDFKWIQNRQAASWIVKDIWPKIISMLEEKNIEMMPKLWVVGKNMPDSLKSIDDKSIHFDEHAPDETYKIYQKSDILLAPIKVGGGSSYKILEAMSSGVPVVTTSLGARGVQGSDGKNLLVGEEAQILAKQVVTLLENHEQYDNIRTNARKLIESEFTWESITKKLESVYEQTQE